MPDPSSSPSRFRTGSRAAAWAALACLLLPGSGHGQRATSAAQPSDTRPTATTAPTTAPASFDLAERHRFRFRRIGASDGLGQGSVYSLLQDRHGFVWIGTQDGLHRYDGYRFEVYEPDPFGVDGLTHGMVRSLLEDREGRLWAGTFRGLDRARPGSKQFDHPLREHFPAFPSAPITALVETADGQLFVGSETQGLVRFSADRTEARWFRAAPDLGTDATPALPSNRIQALHADAEGGLFIGFGDAGLAYLDPLAERLERISLDALPSDLGVHAIVAAARSSEVDSRTIRLWLALPGHGLASYDRQTGATRLYRHDPTDPASLADDAVETLLVDRKKRLWIGTLGGGLDLLEEGSERFVHFRHNPADPSSLSHDHVRALLEDDSGLIWVGTALGGVTLINPRSRFGLVRADPEVPGSLPSNVVRAFLEDSRGALWVATDGGGTVRLDRQTGQFRQPGREESGGGGGGGDRSGGRSFDRSDDRSGRDAPDEDPSSWTEERTWSLFEDRDGRIWIGGQERLYRYDPASDSLDRFAHDPADPTSLGGGSVRSLLQDEAGRIWIAHFGGGLSRLDRGEERFDRFRPNPRRPFTLVSDLVLVLYADRRGQMWIGTAEGLARRTADGRFHAYRHDPDNRTSLLGDIVRAIHQDSQGNLWVGTDAGLDRLPAERVLTPPLGTGNSHGFSHYTELDGLPDNTVYGILEDRQGLLWLSTNNGLSRFDPATETFTNFDLGDGLQGLEFNGGAHWQSADGRLYFGGVAGYNVFDPQRIETNRYVPPVVVTRIGFEGAGERSGETASGPVEPWLADEIVLRHDEPFVSFEFAALDFTNSRANRYAYRIDGLDDAWHSLGTRNQITLTSPRAGEYRLRVRGSNDDGIWNETGASLGLRVRPALWQSRWAWILYALALLSAVALGSAHVRRRRALERQIDEVVRTSERRLDLALQGSGDALWDWNLDTDETHRYRIAEMLGYDEHELPSDDEFREILIHPDDQQRVEEEIRAHLAGETDRLEVEVRMRDRLGRWRWILDRGTIVERHEDGRPRRMAGTFKDMSSRKQVETELRLWATVFESVDEGVLIVDTRDRLQAVNDAFCRMSGYRREELLGRPASLLESAAHADSFYRRIRHAVAVRGSWSGEIRQRTRDGSDILAAASFNAVHDPKGGISHYVAVIRNVTQEKAAEEELRYLATCDVLTGLPNRSHFHRRLSEALEQAGERDDGRIALLFGDLDQFKQVNDTLGHALGDLLLQQVSQRLLASVREGDVVARLGGDEFTVLLDDVLDREMVVRVADRILASFGKPFDLDGQEIVVSTSLGISLYPEDGADADTLLKHADTAMYDAKARGRNRYRFYTREMTERALARMSLDNRLRRALQSNELELYYQPKLDLTSGEVTGLEALVRWPQPDGACLTPAGFLEVAEATGLIVPIDSWVLETACRAAAGWQEALPGVGVSVNLASSLLDRDDLVERLERLLEQAGLPAELLVLELTEDAIMEESALEESGPRLDRLRALRRLGCRLSIDDFGTGYSSLSHLERLPIDELKIDRTFVGELAGQGKASIPRTILAMAAGLELEVVAEGVETLEQLRALQKEGCQRAQGYLISAPLPLDQLLGLVTSPRPPWTGLLRPTRRRPARREAAAGARGRGQKTQGAEHTGERSGSGSTTESGSKPRLRIVE